jgi:hypothetical protein
MSDVPYISFSYEVGGDRTGDWLGRTCVTSHGDTPFDESVWFFGGSDFNILDFFTCFDVVSGGLTTIMPDFEVTVILLDETEWRQDASFFFVCDFGFQSFVRMKASVFGSRS